MTITISSLSTVLLIFLIHTILTHLLNWFFRKFPDDGEVILPIMACTIELLFIVYLLVTIL